MLEQSSRGEPFSKKGYPPDPFPKTLDIGGLGRGVGEPFGKRFPQDNQRSSTQEISAEMVQKKGHPEVEIIRYAEETKEDLIVMGAYGHSRIKELMLGSTTTYVIRKSGVPVLMTR